MQKRGVSRLFVQNFLSHSTKKFRWGTLRYVRKFQVSKNFIHQRGGGGITFLRRKLFVIQYRKFSLGNTRCFRKFRVSQNFMHKGISLNSFEKSLSHSADKIRRRTLLCFEGIRVSKIFKQGRGKLHSFVEIFFISQDRKNFTREPFCVSEDFW